MNTIRAAVVSLLVDVDTTNGGLLTGDTIRHTNGQPFTADETALVLSAHRGEVEAAQRYCQTARDYHQAQLRDVHRVAELVDPYFAGLPDDANLGDVRVMMTDAERAELDAILDRLAPDGYFDPHSRS